MQRLVLAGRTILDDVAAHPDNFRATLAGAMREVTRASSPGDLVVLIGAQGMDDGARLLREAVDSKG
jgi:UDP-N-acetylmuramate-alanine ligase